MSKRFSFMVTAIAVLAIGLIALPAFGQFGEAKGGIHGTTVDQQGGVLPGVSVTIKGPGAPQTVFTDARGEFHAINLPPGTYTLTLALAGFSTVNRENVAVNLGRDTELRVTMALSSVAATVTVTGEAPVIDTRKVALGAAVTQEELRDIPTSRDPWVILQTIPGVQVDRMNIAGSESGQQSVFSSKGSSGGSFTVDGVNLTDMSALGASAGYYDFDSFQEMSVVTGGSDPSMQGSGAHLNMITKRGTNDLHGSARVFDVDHHFQSKNISDEAKNQVSWTGQGADGYGGGVATPLAAGNHIDSVQDYGIEAGGPVWKDHLWLWGSYGRDQINLITAGGAGVSDKTTLEDFNAKLDWQVIPSNAVNIWYLRSDKLKFGRNAGPTHPQPTTWDQILPQNTWKYQDSEVFTSSLFASVSYSGQNGQFNLTPEGGLNRQSFYDANGSWQNTYLFYSAPRPQRQVKADTSFFFNTGSIGHELKAGFSYLKAGVTSTSIWPGSVDCAGCPPPYAGNGQAAQTFGSPAISCGVPCAAITRNGVFSVEAKYIGLFLGDTVTVDRLTINAGVRHDHQYGKNLPSSIPANVSFPTTMPALNYPGDAVSPVSWSDWQPRVGITYALGSNRSTLLKASYARYAEALGTGTVATINPLAGASYAYFDWTDANGDLAVQPGEVNLSAYEYGINYNSTNPGAVGTPTNGMDPNLKAPKTTEFIVGVDHELVPAFAVGVNYTHRKFTDVLYNPTHVYDPTTGTLTNPADYILVGNTSTFTYRDVTGAITGQPLVLPDGTPINVPIYAYAPGGVVTAVPDGSFLMNRPNFDETYDGVELVLTKRLANKWMARGSFTWNNNKQHVGAGACIDPSNLLTSTQTHDAQTCRDGDFVAPRSTGSGSKGSVFLNSKWQFNVLGMYQLPLGFNVAGNLYGRQGYPTNYFINVSRAGGTPTNVLGDNVTRSIAVTPSDSPRYDNVYEFDVRVEKVSNITASSTLTVSLDLFNLTNQGTVLQRQNQLYATCRASTGICGTGGNPVLSTRNTIREIQSPRIFRFGARLAF